MVDNRIRGKQLFEQAKEGSPLSGAESPFKGKFTKMLVGIRSLFKKPPKGGLQPVQESKKQEFTLPVVFSALKLDLRSINQALALILAGLLIMTVYVIFRQPPDISSVTAAVSKINFQDIGTNVIVPFEQLAFYLDQIKKRDIFNEYVEYVPPSPVMVEAPSLPPPPPKVTIQEKAKNLILMGISWGDRSKAIIRNESTREVLFLEEGQKIEGTEIIVKEILKEGVVISYGDETMNLL